MTTAASTTYLQRLVGEWAYRLAATDDSEAPGFVSEGTETVRAISEHWVAVDNTGQDGSRQVTLVGFDPAKGGRASGAVATSATPAMFIYDGELSADENSLVLETEGPAMMGRPGTDRYRDIFGFDSDDRRSVTSQVLGPDGAWSTFMRADYQRAG